MVRCSPWVPYSYVLFIKQFILRGGRTLRL